MLVLLVEVEEGLRNGLLTLMDCAVVERRRIKRRTRRRMAVDPRRWSRAMSFVVAGYYQSLGVKM